MSDLIEHLPQVSLGTAAVLIFAAIVVLVMLRGLVRILWGTLVLCGAAYVAFVAWRHSHTLAERWLGRDATWLSILLPLAAFIGTLLVVRFVTGIVRRPPGSSEEPEGGGRSSLGWLKAIVLSLIPAGLLYLSGGTLLHHAGSIAEIHSFVSRTGEDEPTQSTEFLARLKQNLDGALPQQWLAKLDPTSGDLRLKLAKLISAGESAPPKAIPVLEEPAMRQMILGDPELRQLAREGRYSEILRDPRLDRLLENPNLRDALSDLEL